MIQVSNNCIFPCPALLHSYIQFRCFAVEIIYDPTKPNKHFPFFINDFSDDPDATTQLHDGYTITLERVDPGQLENEMFGAWVEENREDAVMVCLPYLSFGHQFGSDEHKNRAAMLNAKGKIVFRARHELGYHLHSEEILSSGDVKQPASGLRVVYFRIIFPTGTVLTDKTYGSDGRLDLNALAYRIEDGLKELTFDCFWHVSFLEDKPRFADKKKQKKKSSYLDDACEGMLNAMNAN